MISQDYLDRRDEQIADQIAEMENELRKAWFDGCVSIDHFVDCVADAGQLKDWLDWMLEPAHKAVGRADISPDDAKIFVAAITEVIAEIMDKRDTSGGTWIHKMMFEFDEGTIIPRGEYIE